MPEIRDQVGNVDDAFFDSIDFGALREDPTRENVPISPIDTGSYSETAFLNTQKESAKNKTLLRYPLEILHEETDYLQIKI